jgi:predicted enzyme related to lactoylglutathione lyase
MLKGLETVVHYVEDVKAAAAWYRKVLGIEPNHDTPYYVGFTVAGDELGLHPAGDHTAKAGTERQTAYWSVADIRQAVAHFVEHGAREQKIDDVGGGILIGSVLDPFGNVLGLVQNPHGPNTKR